MVECLVDDKTAFHQIRGNQHGESEKAALIEGEGLEFSANDPRLC